MNDWKDEVAAEFECHHELEQVTKIKLSNGTWQVVRQCLRCGAKTSNALPHRDYNLAELPEYDQVLRDEWWQDYLQRRQDAAEQHRAEAQIVWRDDYSDYLESPHWHQVRRRVLVRDNFRCQNCFKPVTEATAHCHHTSYDGLRRVGHSFAFECVTLCRTCHEDYHSHMAAARPEEPRRGNGHV